MRGRVARFSLAFAATTWVAACAAPTPRAMLLSTPEVEIAVDSATGFVSRAVLPEGGGPEAVALPAEAAREFLEINESVLFPGLSSESLTLAYESDDAGTTAVRFDQVFGEVPVLDAGATAVVEGGQVRWYSASLENPPAELITVPTIGADSAAAVAARAFGERWALGALETDSIREASFTDERPTLAIVPPELGGEFVLAWRVVLPDADYFVGAHDAVVLHVRSTIANAFAIEAHDLDGEVVDAYEREWGDLALTQTSVLLATVDSEVVAMQQAFQVVHGYFFDVLGRDGYDGRGGVVRAAARAQGLRSLAQTFPPDADGMWHRFQGGFATLDLVGHEFVHAIAWANVPRRSRLSLYGESGAVVEGIADFLAVVVEGETTGTFDWRVGDRGPKVLGAVRDLGNPGAGGFQRGKPRGPGNLGMPDRYDERVAKTDDICGGAELEGCAHLNSGILSHALATAVIQGMEARHLAAIVLRALPRVGSAPRLKTAASAIVDVCDDRQPPGGCLRLTQALEAAGLLQP